MKRTLVLFEDEGFVNLLPLLFWRSVFELQVGRKIPLDRLAQRLSLPVSGVWTRDWIAAVAAQRCGAPSNQPVGEGAVLANGRWVCDEAVNLPPAPHVGTIGEGIAYIVCDATLAARLRPSDLLDPVRREAALQGVPRSPARGRMIRYPWDLVSGLIEQLNADFTTGDALIETELDPRLVLPYRERMHVGERTVIHPTVVIDASSPIYVGHDVSVGAYAVLEGPLFLGAGSRVHPHAWLHGGNAIGPMCKVAGEMVGCVLHGYSNKQHHGFLGHSVTGSWVNIGAGATNSNLKNTYGRVRAPINGRPVDTGLQLFGAVIGDHVKLGINSAIPTGGVIGLAAAVATPRLLPKFVPSFGWVADDELKSGDPMRSLDVASAVMARRNLDMTDEEVELFLDLGSRVREYELATAS